METGIYVRVSTEEQAQEGFSIRAQEQKLKDYARIKDWSIYKIYADEGISGKNLKNRPAVNELLEDVRLGNVCNVLVFKIDRLTRSTADLIYLVDVFNNYDCAFNSLMESIDTQTASGRMFLKIIGIFAEFERENIIERVKLGVERKVKEGYSLCTVTASFGYDRPKLQKIQSVNEEEADIVREVFDLYVNQGVTLTDIARQLNIRKIQTKGNANWSSTKVRRVLSNCNYVGNVRHHIADDKRGAEFDGLHEAIIEQELYDKAQGLLAKNKAISPRKKPNEDRYFAGFLVCAECGYKLKTYNTQKQLKTRVQTTTGYMCGNKTLKTCTASSMSHKKVEAAFEQYIANIADLNVSAEMRLIEREQKRRDNSELIQTYEAKLKQLEAKEREALSLYVSDSLDFAEYRAVKAQVDKDKQFIAADLDRLQDLVDNTSISAEDIIDNFAENWALLSEAERRQFLLQFVDGISVISEKQEGEYYNTVRITDIAFRGAR